MVGGVHVGKFGNVRDIKTGKTGYKTFEEVGLRDPRTRERVYSKRGGLERFLQ